MKRLACALVLAGSAVAFVGVTSDTTAATKSAADKLLLSIVTRLGISVIIILDASCLETN